MLVFIILLSEMATFVQSTGMQFSFESIWTLPCWLSLSTLRWEPISKGLSLFPGFLHHFLLTKLATGRLKAKGGFIKPFESLLYLSLFFSFFLHHFVLPQLATSSMRDKVLSFHDLPCPPCVWHIQPPWDTQASASRPNLGHISGLPLWHPAAYLQEHQQ